MARVNNLSNFLTDVASAIKTKKGSETNIPAANFDTEILALPSQGTYEQRVLNISANGTQTITPSSGYDAIDELELTVAVPEKQLQSKTYNFTQNTNIQLLPDSGYDGFDTVTLNINVPTIDTSDATATVNDIVENKTAYVNGQKITGNISERRNTQYLIPIGRDTTIRNQPRSQSVDVTSKVVDVDNSYVIDKTNKASISMPYADVASAIGLTAEKIVSGNTILGIEGTGGAEIHNQDKTITQNGTYTADQGYTGLGEVNVNVPSTSNVYKFATLAEAQAKNDYNPGDIAIVTNIESVPFYPQIWIRNSNIDWCIVSVNDTVVLDEPVNVDASESWTTQNGNKTNTYTVKLQITPTEATIQLPYGMAMSNKVIHWTSQDGLTYQFDKGSSLNYDTTDPKGGLKVLSITSNGTNRASLFDLLSNHWDDFSLMSKFLVYKNSDIIQNYYQYRGVSDSSDTITTFYPYNLLSCIYAENGEIIDIFPQKNLYTFNMDWVTNISASSDMLLDIGDYIYVGVEIGYRTDTNSLFTYVNLTTATTDSGYYRVIDKSTLEVTQVPISGSGIPIVTSANSITSYAYIIDLPILEDYKYLHINCTTSDGVKQLSSLINSLPNVVFIDNSNRFVENHSFDDSYGFCQHPVVSLSLQEIRKPDLDMCITLANSILGVS